MQTYCVQPFTSIEIGNYGDVFMCCPAFIDNAVIGNIWEDRLEDIWHSDIAVEQRKRILNNDYSHCNMTHCRQNRQKGEDEYKEYLCEKPPLPLYITLSYDNECNLNCITCRDKKYKNSKDETELYNDKFLPNLISFSANAKIIALSGSGEAFFSKHSRFLIQKIAEANKNILFNINTNGILFNEANCKKLGIYGRINEVFLSLPALDKRLYEKIRHGGDYKTVIKNIEWMAKEYYEGRIKCPTFNFVISKMNYTQIPKLVGFAKQLGVKATLSPFCDWGTKWAKENQDYAVWEKTNKEFDNFVKVLNEMPEYDWLVMPQSFSELLNRQKNSLS